MDSRRFNRMLSNQLMDQIGAAVGVEIGRAHRIILDLEVGKPPRVYIEFYGDARMLEMDLSQLSRGDVVMRTTRDDQGGD